MKRNVIFLVCVLLATIAFGQNKTTHVKVDEIQVTPPKFTGDMNATELFYAEKSSPINNYLANNFVCPTRAAESNKEGTEVIQFTVTASGWLTDFKVINSVSKEVDEELIKLLKQTNGMWLPGSNNEKPTAMQQEVSMMFGNYNQDEIINHFVGQSEKYFAMGSANLLTEQKTKKALKYLNNSVRYTPNDKAALMLRGICYYELGKTEDAIRDWKRIVALGGIDYSLDYHELAEMKGYSEMTKILAGK